MTRLLNVLSIFSILLIESEKVRGGEWQTDDRVICELDLSSSNNFNISSGVLRTGEGFITDRADGSSLVVESPFISVGRVSDAAQEVSSVATVVFESEPAAERSASSGLMYIRYSLDMKLWSDWIEMRESGPPIEDYPQYYTNSTSRNFALVVTVSLKALERYMVALDRSQATQTVASEQNIAIAVHHDNKLLEEVIPFIGYVQMRYVPSVTPADIRRIFILCCMPRLPHEPFEEYRWHYSASNAVRTTNWCFKTVPDDFHK